MKLTTTRKKDFWCMGTDVCIEVDVGIQMSRKADEVLKKAEDIFKENEDIFSRFQDSSELSKINDNLNKEQNVSDKMFETLELCQKFYDFSGGYFDPRIIENLETSGYDKDFRTNNLNKGKEQSAKKITGELSEDMVLDPAKKTVLLKKRIDTTGVVKGYTVDEVSSLLREKGFDSFCVNAGGDMFISRPKKSLDIAVNIEGLENILLRMNNEGIATSGITRKKWETGGKIFHHLVNPKNTENFSNELKTVTAISGDTTEADALAKSLFLMGKERGMKFAEENKIKALFLDNECGVKMSEAMEDNRWVV